MAADSNGPQYKIATAVCDAEKEVSFAKAVTLLLTLVIFSSKFYRHRDWEVFFFFLLAVLLAGCRPYFVIVTKPYFYFQIMEHRIRCRSRHDTDRRPTALSLEHRELHYLSLLPTRNPFPQINVVPQ